MHGIIRKKFGCIGVELSEDIIKDDLRKTYDRVRYCINNSQKAKQS